MAKNTLAITGLIMLVSPTFADVLLSAPPIYDVEAGCRRQNGAMDRGFNQCVASEQSHYDNIKFMWPGLSAHGRSRMHSVFAEIKRFQGVPVRAYDVLSTVMIDELERERADSSAKTPQRFSP